MCPGSCLPNTPEGSGNFDRLLPKFLNSRSTDELYNDKEHIFGPGETAVFDGGLLND